MRRHRQAPGLSLLETVVLSGLIALVLLLSVGLIPTFSLANRRARAELEAGRLAQSLLETERAKAFEEIQSKASEEITEQDEIVYRTTLSVKPESKGITKRIRVEVSWKWKGRDYSTFRETLLVRVPR